MSWFRRIVLAAVALSIFSPTQQSAHAVPAPERDWVLIYVMSYDNNLTRFGPGILDALGRGVRGGKTVVTVLADDPNPNGLNRYVITSDGISSHRLPTDDSASEVVLGDYLSWAAKTYPAKHYAIVFLDHGGRLYEMCLDERPGGGGTKHWMDGRRVGERLRAFRAEAPGTVELVFLQQCGRGSVENLYNFNNTASVVLASQHNVGAPNTYYEPTLHWLDAHPDATGSKLASRIMADDRHFTSYASFDGKALVELPHRLGPVVKALIDNDTAVTCPTGMPPCYESDNEIFFDLIEWLEAAYRENRRPAAALDEFSRWARKELLIKVVTSRGSRSVCGLSLFVPQTEGQRTRYQNEPVCRESDLGRLWEAVRRGR